jgi:hypothetical protein
LKGVKEKIAVIAQPKLRNFIRRLSGSLTNKFFRDYVIAHPEDAQSGGSATLATYSHRG